MNRSGHPEPNLEKALAWSQTFCLDMKRPDLIELRAAWIEAEYAASVLGRPRVRLQAPAECAANAALRAYVEARDNGRNQK